MRISTRTVAGTFLILGGFLAWVSILFQHFAWRIAICASQYRPASFVVESVTFGKHGGHIRHTGRGTVNEHSESIPLYGFGPTPDSQLDLERAYPRGTVLSILYDPEVPKNTVLMGTSLRILPRTHDLEGSLRTAILTTLGWMAPLAAGLVFHVIASRQERARRKNAIEVEEARKSAWPA